MKIFFILILFSSFFAKAHPVIYKDGFVYWGVYWGGVRENTQMLSYTFHPRFAVQFSSDFKQKHHSIYQLGLNVLVKRWLLENSQANIYTSLQSGIYADELSEIYKSRKKTKFPMADKLRFQWDLSADWESREIYTAGNIALAGRPNWPKTLWGNFEYRIGFAPYVANMDVLQTWFVVMFQVSGLGTLEKDLKNTLLTLSKQKKSQYRKALKLGSSTVAFNWKITPLLRFFYKNVLWEIGSSLKSDFYLTLMIHY